jgi:tripartite-type tricarboxylate transporter receptor subunit TctC
VSARPGRRALLAAATAAPWVLPGGVAERAAAQPAFPARPIRLIVPFAPGGISDSYARVLGKAAGDLLGQAIVVENKPGAGTVIGTEAVVRAKPDGYTLLLSSAPLVTNPGLLARMPYDALKDLAPVIKVSGQGFVISVSPRLPHRTLDELLAAARERDTPYATPGTGTLMHLVGQLFNVEHGTRFVHVPYRGSAQAMQDVLAGQVSVLIDPLSTSLPQIQQGQLRPLAVTHPERLAALPAVRTVRELGYPAAEAVAFAGLLAPAGTPPDVVARLNAAFNQAMREPEVRETIEVRLNSPLAGGTAQDFARFLREETDRWVPLIRRLAIRAD